MSSTGGLADEQPWEGVGSAGEYTSQTSLHREHPRTRDGQSEATELQLKHMKAECRTFRVTAASQRILRQRSQSVPMVIGARAQGEEHHARSTAVPNGPQRKRWLYLKSPDYLQNKCAFNCHCKCAISDNWLLRRWRGLSCCTSRDPLQHYLTALPQVLYTEHWAQCGCVCHVW